MATTLGLRPSHYDVLGLTPSATEQDIAQAFARKMSLFRARPLTDLAQVTAAYETLRNPEKRREYDHSLAPKPEPKPEPERLAWSFALAQPAWRPFIASVPANAAPPSMAPLRQTPEPHVTASAAPTASADARLEAIANSLRELSKPGFGEASAPAQQPERTAEKAPAATMEERRVDPEQEPGLDDVIQQIRIAGRREKERLREEEPRSPDWRKPVFAAGGLILGVGILGGMAGVLAGGAAQDSVTVPVPAAKPAANLPALPAPGLIEAQAKQAPPEARPVAPRASRVPLPPKPGFAENELVELSPAVASAPPATSDSLDAQPVAAPVPASLPLPNSVIARTIDRIGYSCGEVASATRVEGEGVFKITCSSGQSYQAAPVGGRYHFRRWSRR